jgi:hypothetical protein
MAEEFTQKYPQLRSILIFSRKEKGAARRQAERC